MMGATSFPDYKQFAYGYWRGQHGTTLYPQDNPFIPQKADDRIPTAWLNRNDPLRETSKKAQSRAFHPPRLDHESGSNSPSINALTKQMQNLELFQHESENPPNNLHDDSNFSLERILRRLIQEETKKLTQPTNFYIDRNNNRNQYPVLEENGGYIESLSSSDINNSYDQENEYFSDNDDYFNDDLQVHEDDFDKLYAAQQRIPKPSTRQLRLRNETDRTADISFGQLLRIAPSLRRQFTGACRTARTLAVLDELPKSMQNTTALYAVFYLHSLPIRTLIDSGASKSCISLNLIQRLKLTIQEPSTAVFMLGNSDRHASLGIINDLPLKPNGTAAIPASLEVLPTTPADLIVGNDWL
ncbi:hypothetical protein INT45_002902 [Circinella minor]|uniref:Peptidase A2 domain-containing protein n=1 Tax=Circinella minor TaxID=1195481 RepID=A0A8H7RU41_9FUNG|nr:hypothetical protein INT45_002902 [Circinella minor]